MNAKQFQSHIGYLSHRSISSKVSTNSPVAGGTHNHQTSFDKVDKEHIKSKKNDNDQISNIHKENSILKEENRVLRRELNYYRAEGILQSYHSKQSKSQVNDLRQTIKKENGEIKDLKTRLEMLSKQCKMYQDIIEKMEGKINKLIEHNNLLQQELKSSKVDPQKFKKLAEGEGNKKNKNDSDNIKMQILTEKVNQILRQYNQLHSQFENEQNQWERWKSQWSKQKTYYLHRIQDLENMMGIGQSPISFPNQKKRH